MSSRQVQRATDPAAPPNAVMALPPDAGAMEKVLLGGDLSALSSVERVQYYRELCASLQINPLTKPFEYLQMKAEGGGTKLTLYTTKNCTDQLRSSHKASSTIVAREIVDGVYIVTARATTPDGRQEESIGAVAVLKEDGQWKTEQSGKRVFTPSGRLIPLRPEERANAMMKAETKAKRRATLSLFGLSFVDDSEVDSIRDAHRVDMGAPLLNAAAVPAPETRQVPAAAESSGQLSHAQPPAKQAAPPTANPTTGVSQPASDAFLNSFDDILPARPIPEELKVAVEKLRAKDDSVIPTATKFLQDECIMLGIEPEFLRISSELRARFPKGEVPIPREELVNWMLNIWDLIISTRAATTATDFAQEVNG